ncbi:Tex-like N-terminal domain-containing protein [Yoonia maritima]|uniref:Tex-like N-terminal domain-containing protein n=1 Tax=Yoonia maritima TaxID=1435347 RepID=UPI000D0EDDC3
MTPVADRIAHNIATDIGARAEQVIATVAMLDGGDTVPFVARYRKEATGGLDDAQLRRLAERLDYLRDLEKGNCYDNAAVETFFKTIKAELIWRRSWQTRRDAELAIFQYINGFYNPRRRHSALGWKSPVAFERKVA